MYEISKGYLERLLKESGVKLGSAKASAMTALIELLDANALDGLLASIREDYDQMQAAVKNLSTLQSQESDRRWRIQQLDKQVVSLHEQIGKAEARIKKLKEEEQTAQFEADLRGCLEEERSRLVAYEAAIRIGKSAFSGSISSDVMAQIVRSASNVAAGFVPVSKPPIEEAPELTPRKRDRRAIL